MNKHIERCRNGHDITRVGFVVRRACVNGKVYYSRYCKRCRVMQRRKLRKNKLNLGLCVRCNKRNKLAVPGRTCCFDCLIKIAIKSARWRFRIGTVC